MVTLSLVRLRAAGYQPEPGDYVVIATNRLTGCSETSTAVRQRLVLPNLRRSNDRSVFISAQCIIAHRLLDQIFTV
jgi:hypothetical protein